MSFYDSERRIRSDERPRTYMQLIERVGDSGRYQKRLLLVLGLSWFVTGIILLSTGFLFRSPALDCQQHGLLVSSLHCEQYVCSLEEASWQDYLSADNHFHSLATSGNYLCSNSVTIALVSSCTYIGAFVGYLVVSFAADNWGRRRALLGAWGVCAAGTVVVASSMRLEVAAVGFFLSGFGSDAGINLSLLFFTEEVGGRKRQKYSIIVQMFFAGGALVVTFFFYLFEHWRVVWCLLVAAPAVIQLLLIHCYVEETPQFLLHAGIPQAVAALNRIGMVNLDRKQTLEEEDLQNVADYQLVADFKDKIISPIDLCRFSSLRGSAVACSVLAFFTYAMYYGPALIMDEVGFNKFFSSALIQLSEILAYLPAYVYAQRLPRRKAGIALFTVVAVLSFILAFLERPNECDGCAHQVVQLVVAFLFRSCVSLFFCIFELYICELFPGRIRAMGTGIVSGFGTLAAVSNPYYLSLIRSHGLNVFNLFFMMAITAITCLALLPETLDQPLNEEIMEMEEEKGRRRSVVTLRSPKIRRREHKSQITYDMMKSKNSRMIQSNRIE